jgi:hypothetical protein
VPKNGVTKEKRLTKREYKEFRERNLSLAKENSELKTVNGQLKQTVLEMEAALALSQTNEFKLSRQNHQILSKTWQQIKALRDHYEALMDSLKQKVTDEVEERTEYEPSSCTTRPKRLLKNSNVSSESEPIESPEKMRREVQLEEKESDEEAFRLAMAINWEGNKFDPAEAYSSCTCEPSGHELAVLGCSVCGPLKNSRQESTPSITPFQGKDNIREANEAHEAKDETIRTGRRVDKRAGSFFASLQPSLTAASILENRTECAMSGTSSTHSQHLRQHPPHPQHPHHHPHPTKMHFAQPVSPGILSNANSTHSRIPKLRSCASRSRNFLALRRKLPKLVPNKSHFQCAVK